MFHNSQIEDRNPRKAVVLLSGGLDSATTLAIAQEQQFVCYCLTVMYGQRHAVEIEASKTVANSMGATEHRRIWRQRRQFTTRDEKRGEPGEIIKNTVTVGSLL